MASGILRNQLDMLLEDAEQVDRSPDILFKEEQTVRRLIEAGAHLSSAQRARLIDALRKQGENHD